jgi:hypothetical protein
LSFKTSWLSTRRHHPAINVWLQPLVKKNLINPADRLPDNIINPILVRLQPMLKIKLTTNSLQ